MNAPFVWVRAVSASSSRDAPAWPLAHLGVRRSGACKWGEQGPLSPTLLTTLSLQAPAWRVGTSAWPD